jgi:hypothetical protein
MKDLEKKENPIVFIEGDEDRVVIETEKYETSLFAQQYTTAFGILKKLIDMPEDDECCPGQGNSRIIAFCGDRGAGKTSCMMSVRYAIEHSGDKDKEGIKTYLEGFGLTPEKLDFDILKPVDPSYFDDSQNILELVLGQMYSHFKAKRQKLKENNELNEETVDNVRKKFDAVQRSLSLINGSSQRLSDKLEELENLSVAMSFYEKLKALFKVYLPFIGKQKILISIDDMDFNAKGAYKMCKYLQMYLNQPSCVIMISLKITQLVSILEDDDNFKNAKVGERRSEMSSKYVQKLIPIANRVQMVDIWSISEREFTIVKRGQKIEEGTRPERIKDGIVRMIFEKTRYLFYNTKGEVSPIIPHELRGFRQLLGLLNSMTNYEKGKKDPVSLARNNDNKLQFKNYFYTEWIRTLDTRDREFAAELAELEDIRSFNKKIVSYLADRAGLNSKDYDDSEYRFRRIIDPQNYTYNISTGDVFSIIRYLDKSTESTDLKDLLFFIKSCYSICLYECYDAITDDMEKMNEEVPDGDVFMSDPWFRKTTKMQSMVNGNYFRYFAGSYIRGLGEKTHKIYNYDKLLLDSTFYSFLDEVVRMIKVDENNPSAETKKKYLLAEFLIMCTSYNYNYEFTNEPDVNRRNSLPFYLEPIAQQVQLVVFDITSVFSNMINIKYSYNRYASFFNFFEYSHAHDWTLLGRLKKDINNVRNVNDYNSEYHAIASDSIIRNSDVLLSLTEMMESNSRRTLAYGLEGAVSRYKLFLEGLYDTGMKTYRVGDDGEAYELHYSFIKTLSKLLDEIPEGKLLDILHSAKDVNESGKAETGIFIGKVEK